MKHKILFILLSVFTFSLFAQNVSVPDKVQKEFDELYPNMKEVKWSNEGEESFEAEFIVNGKSTSVVINDEGKLLEIETVIEIKDLPKDVESFVLKNYRDYKITEAAKIMDDKGVLTYEAEISKNKGNKDLMFDKDGKFIDKKIKKSEKEETEEDEED